MQIPRLTFPATIIHKFSRYDESYKLQHCMTHILKRQTFKALPDKNLPIPIRPAYTNEVN